MLEAFVVATNYSVAYIDLKIELVSFHFVLFDSSQPVIEDFFESFVVYIL